MGRIGEALVAIAMVVATRSMQVSAEAGKGGFNGRQGSDELWFTPVCRLPDSPNFGCCMRYRLDQP